MEKYSKDIQKDKIIIPKKWQNHWIASAFLKNAREP